MTLANELYTYRRLPKTTFGTNSNRHDAEAVQFPRPKRPTDLAAINRHQIEHSVLQQAAAERVLYFTATSSVYEVDAHPRAIRLNNYGVKYLDFDLPRAFRCFRDATTLDPSFPLAWNNLGLVYLQIGDLKQATEHFETAIIKGETLDIAWGNAGLAYLEAGDYEAAWQHLDQAINLDTQESIHYNNLGILCLELDFPQEAIQLFDLAIKLDPKLPMLYHNRGRAHIRLGNAKQGDKDIIKAYRMDQAEQHRAGAQI